MSLWWWLKINTLIAGALATYIRFIPYIKKNYDYGIVIFLLTFNLIAVSSYRVDNVLKIAHERVYTIAIGCAVCLLMSLLVFPNWSGEDLHNSTVYKLEGLAKSIEGTQTSNIQIYRRHFHFRKVVSSHVIYICWTHIQFLNFTIFAVSALVLNTHIFSFII